MPARAASYREGSAAPNTRKIDQSRGLPVHTIIIDIFRNAHDYAPLRVSIDSDAFPKRIPRVGPIFTRHVLRHYCHTALAEQIVPCEIPASNQPRAKRGKESRRNLLNGSVRRDSAIWRLVLDRDRIAIFVLQFQRQSRGEPRRRNTGDSGNLVEKFSLRLGQPLDLSYLGFGKKQPDRLNLLGMSEARSHFANAKKLRISNPAPTNNTKASATCATTSAFCARNCSALRVVPRAFRSLL